MDRAAGTGDDAVAGMSVVVPVYRNAETLDTLYQRLCATLGTLERRYELIFVNDSGPDRSLQVLERLAARDPRVAVLDLQRNYGQHIAILIGLAYSRGPWTVVLDADLQDPPEAIPGLLAAAEDCDAAAVFAGRRGQYQSWHRRLTSRCFKFAMHALCRLPKDAGVYVAIRADLRDAMVSFPTRFPVIVSIIGCSGFPTISVPVPRARRTVGRSAYSSFSRVRVALRAFGCVVEHRFLKPSRPFLGRLDEDPVGARIGRRFTESRGANTK